MLKMLCAALKEFDSKDKQIKMVRQMISSNEHFLTLHEKKLSSKVLSSIAKSCDDYSDILSESKESDELGDDIVFLTAMCDHLRRIRDDRISVIYVNWDVPIFNHRSKYYKMIGADRKAFGGYEYKLGRNDDTSLTQTGLHITNPNHLHLFFYHGPMVAQVSLPKSATVYVDHEQFTSNCLFVEKLVHITEIWDELFCQVHPNVQEQWLRKKHLVFG